jgi:DNA-binding GntR family transcriptional regulator
MRYDLDVHRSIYEANGNRHLAEVLITYDNLATRIWCMVIDRLPDVSSHIAEHVDLLTAIVGGNCHRCRSNRLRARDLVRAPRASSPLGVVAHEVVDAGGGVREG